MRRRSTYSNNNYSSARHENLTRLPRIWIKYGQLTRANTDRAVTIQFRHQFFMEKMYELLKPQLKDPTRSFGALERELIYYRDKKKCQVCGADVTWSDHEIHHVDQHSQGGPTTLANGVWYTSTVIPKGPKPWETSQQSGKRSSRNWCQLGFVPKNRSDTNSRAITPAIF